jgi:hypothetical protein
MRQYLKNDNTKSCDNPSYNTTARRWVNQSAYRDLSITETRYVEDALVSENLPVPIETAHLGRGFQNDKIVNSQFSWISVQRDNIRSPDRDGWSLQ